MGKPVFSSYPPLQFKQFPDYNFTFWAPLSSLLLDDINQDKGELIWASCLMWIAWITKLPIST